MEKKIFNIFLTKNLFDFNENQVISDIQRALWEEKELYLETI